jgi:hypothetical protein
MATGSTSQVDNGKAFEFAVAHALSMELNIPIADTPEFQKTKSSFEKVKLQLQERFTIAAAESVRHILEKEEKKL